MVQQKKPDEFLEVGCDYITATTRARGTQSSLRAFGAYLVREEKAALNKRRTWRFSEYIGETCGSVSCGTRHDGSILRASGHVADEHWQQILNLACNVSRFDLQASVLPCEGPQERLAVHRHEVKNGPRRRGKPIKFKYWGGPTGLEALALGRRISDRFLRVYDKGIESGRPHYIGVLRYEAEAKRRYALALAKWLDQQEDFRGAAIAWLRAFAIERNLHIGIEAWPSSSANLKLAVANNRKNRLDAFDRRLTWASKSLKPFIKDCVAANRLEELIEALGLADYVNLVDRPRWAANIDFKKGVA